MASNTTKEGIDVKPGQVWENLDKRMKGRKVYIWHVADGVASYHGYTDYHGATGRAGKLKVRRMHKTTTGWRLLFSIHAL